MHNSDSSTFPRYDGTSAPTIPISEDQTRNVGSSLSWEMRVQCFVGCFALSVISSVCASYLLVLMRLSGFCVLTSIGAILSLTSTCFLMGPVGQCKKMFDKSRWIATVVYISFIILALISGLVLENAPLAIICTVGEYIGMAWYSLSYIPYAREAVSKILCSCL